jgi:VanZ family protein
LNGRPNAASGFNGFWLLWLLPVTWASIIFWLSSQSFVDIPGPDFEFKPKLGHWLLYCVLSGLLAAPMRWAHGVSLKKTLALAIIVASIYGATDEFHQSFVPDRTPRVTDWMIDTLGATFGAAMFYAYESYRRPKKNR